MQRSDYLVGGAALLVCLGVLLLFGGDILALGYHVSQNPNEGWNAYHARDLFSGRALYPAPPSFIYNNYPPLSFALVGMLGRVLGDEIIAGRLISLVAAPGIAACLFLAARNIGARRHIAALSGLIFLASPWTLSRLAGVDDPQLLGDLLDAIALVILTAKPDSFRHVAWAGLFLTAAEFVKPLFVALPLAVLVWLWLRDRRQALVLLAVGLGLSLLGLGLTGSLLGVNLLHQMFDPRVFLFSKMFAQPGQWLVTEALPLIASLILWRRDSFCRLGALYAGFAFLFSVFFSGGDGVSASQTIDASMAVAFGTGLYLSRAAPRPRLTGFALMLMALALVLAFFGRWGGGLQTTTELAHQQPVARADIARIAREKGPVFCETEALCYWAGKPQQVDGFGLSQAFKTRTRSQSDLVALIAAHRYVLIQLAPRSPFAFSPAIQAALAAAYRLDHEDALGRYLTPKGVSPARSAQAAPPGPAAPSHR